MRIGCIGAGNVGGALGRLWQDAGHDVRVGGRNSVVETAAHGDVVLLAVPSDAVDDALLTAGSLDGKVLIDATNDLAGDRHSQAGHVADLAPGARVVKAFNAFFASNFGKARELDPPAQLLFCGDDKDAKETVASLIGDIGLDPLDVGGLDQAPNIEGFARTVINLGYVQGRGQLVYRFEAIPQEA